MGRNLSICSAIVALPALGLLLAPAAGEAQAPPQGARGRGQPVTAEVAPPADLEVCEAELVGPIEHLISGASEQTLYIRTFEACPALTQVPTGRPVTVRPAVDPESFRIDGEHVYVQTEPGGQQILELLLREVPQTLPNQTMWEIAFHHPSLRLRFRGRSLESVRTRSLEIRYRNPTLGRGGPALREPEGYVAVVDPSILGQAAYEPDFHPQRYEIVNRADLRVPEAVATWRWVRPPQLRAARIPVNDEAGDQGGGQLLWCGQLSGTLGFLLGLNSEVLGRGEAAPINRGLVRMLLSQSHGSADEVALRVWVVAAPFDDAVPTSERARQACAGGQRLATFEHLRVAHRMREESLPFPLRDHVRLECGDQETDAHGDILTPLADQLRDCRLRYERPAQLGDREDVQRAFCIYGTQRVRVRIKAKDGAVLRTYTWPLPVTAASSTFPLGLGTLSAPHGEYRVEATIEPPNEAIVYRAEAEPTEAERDDDSYRFEAWIRSRGEFGLPVDLRFFVTVPIAPLTLRVPARARSLPSSTTFAGMERMDFRVGLMLAAEPWDYAQRRNSLHPVALRFLIGGFLYEANDQIFSPTFDVGASIALPLQEAPSQLGTSISLSVLAEYDALSGTWGALIAVSAELLSLFSAET